MAWRWDKRAARYRDDATGRFLGAGRVRGMVEASLGSSKDAVETLGGMVFNEEVSAGDWVVLMRAEIKQEYIRQYLAGRGGRSVMTSADWGRIGGMLTEQYRYLNGFADAVRTGDLSEGQIVYRGPLPRSRMYANSAREAFHRAETASKNEAGYTEERRVLTADESCSDCIALANRGWQPIGTLPQPGDGSTVCLTNDRCYKEYQ